MRFVVAIMLSILGTPAISQHDLSFFRNTFHSSQDEAVLETILTTVPQEEDEANMATIMAYKAVSETMKAEHKFSPISKLQLFNAGKGKLEAVLEARPTTEARYLRLLVQLNVPGILNYSNNIEEDLDHLARTLKDESLPYYDKLMFRKTLAALTKKEEYLEIINNLALN